MNVHEIVQHAIEHDDETSAAILEVLRLAGDLYVAIAGFQAQVIGEHECADGRCPICIANAQVQEAVDGLRPWMQIYVR